MIYWCYLHRNFYNTKYKEFKKCYICLCYEYISVLFSNIFLKNAMSHSILFVCLSLLYKILIESLKTYTIYSSKTLVNFAIFILEILLYIFFKRWRLFQFHLLLYIFLSVLAIFFHQILHQQPQLLYYLQIV